MGPSFHEQGGAATINQVSSCQCFWEVCNVQTEQTH